MFSSAGMALQQLERTPGWRGNCCISQRCPAGRQHVTNVRDGCNRRMSLLAARLWGTGRQTTILGYYQSERFQEAQPSAGAPEVDRCRSRIKAAAALQSAPWKDQLFEKSQWAWGSEQGLGQRRRSMSPRPSVPAIIDDMLEPAAIPQAAPSLRMPSGSEERMHAS